MSKIIETVSYNFGREVTLSYETPEKQTCPQCGREIVPDINFPHPGSGRYNGYADCRKCGAILFSISSDEFENEEEPNC